MIGVGKGDSMSQNILPAPKLMIKYFSLDFRPYFKRSSIISPSPWSNTFSRNFDERLKKSVKTRDLTTEFNSSLLSSALNNKYDELISVVPLSYRLLFSSACVPEAAANLSLFTLLPFLLWGGCREIGSLMRTGLPCHRFQSLLLQHECYRFSEGCAIFFKV
jgi:hypothetical protein